MIILRNYVGVFFLFCRSLLFVCLFVLIDPFLHFFDGTLAGNDD